MNTLFYEESSSFLIYFQECPAAHVPNNVSEDILTCKNELLKEGKKVAFILKEEKVIAVIGYQE